MAVNIQFSKELLEWARGAEFTFGQAREDPEEWMALFKGRPYFASRGGELIYFIDTRDDGWLVVTNSERRSREDFQFAARSQFVLERYFFGYFGKIIRGDLRLPGNRRLPALNIPALEDEIYPGYSIQVVEFEGESRRALIDPSGEWIALSQASHIIGTGTLVRVSAYLNVSVADLEATFQSPEGLPLWGLREPPASEPKPLAASRPPEGVAEQDARELIELIGTDEYVNGVNEDVIAHRHTSGHRPPIRRDESWTGFLYFFYVGQGYTETSGFRYGGAQAALPFKVPFGVSDETQERIEGVLARARDAGDLPLERRWNAAAIIYDRASGRGDVRVFYGADAEQWQVSFSDADEIAARGENMLRQLRAR